MIPEGRLKLVTAADTSHFRSLIQFIKSVVRFEPRVPIIVYDLGLTEGERCLLSGRFSLCDMRRFDFAAYPPHLNLRIKAGEYAWKPVIVWDVLAVSDMPVCWMDAGNVLVDELDGILKALSVTGFYSPYSPGTIGEWTHPKMLRYQGVYSTRGIGQEQSPPGSVPPLGACLQKRHDGRRRSRAARFQNTS